MVSVLVASATKSASGNSGILNLGLGMGSPDAANFILNVSASSSPTTLDVYLQTSTDGGTTWYDFDGGNCDWGCCSCSGESH
jgi:hypothetical protein